MKLGVLGVPGSPCAIHERPVRVLAAPSPCPLPRGRGNPTATLFLSEGEGRGGVAHVFTANPRYRRAARPRAPLAPDRCSSVRMRSASHWRIKVWYGIDFMVASFRSAWI
jgi:hypothetical protein